LLIKKILNYRSKKFYIGQSLSLAAVQNKLERLSMETFVRDCLLFEDKAMNTVPYSIGVQQGVVLKIFFKIILRKLFV
jgi:hypothetical protein